MNADGACPVFTGIVYDSRMAIPPLDTHGFLPPGVHDCTLDELRARFGVFCGTDTREQLFGKLHDFMTVLGQSGFVEEVVVDGSFTSAKDRPDDIDLMVVLKPEHDFEADLGPMDYNLLSKKRVRRRWGFDVFVAAAGSREYEEYTAFYQRVKDRPDLTKGVLRIRP